ncbi:uncharacterized protein LOC136032350 [Artemia franciscana]|uniref:uncharacterized protein LOC136032350 n=1 Tax=Artemia franciscana TaxID=6661 RepID=UPI0032DA60E9
MSPAARRAMLKWTPVNERIIYARFWSAHGKLSIVACYAPTNEADEIEKDNFYETLQSIVAEIPRHDIICVVGDLNVKVGYFRNYCPEITGKHEIGDMNENRALLVDFALNNDLVIRGTLFQHKTIHKYTWTSPDGRMCNQIDHLIFSRKWRKSLIDVRGYRGTDIQSDHNLMVAKIHLKKSAKLSILLASDASESIVLQVSYGEIDKQVKKSVRTDKRQFFEQKAALAEETAKKEDLKTVYRLTNEMIGFKPNRTNLVKDENGAFLSDPLMIDERLASHIENLLNRPRINDQDIIPDTPFMILNVNEEPPSPKEIIATVRKLRNGRMLGVDGITSELLKSSVYDCMTVWVEFLTQIWIDQKVPSDWTKGTIIRLFKGDALVCGNWRGINIMSIPSKLLSIIIQQRLQQKLDKYLCDEQHGFQPGRSCADLIFTLRMLVDDSKEWKKSYIFFSLT